MISKRDDQQRAISGERTSMNAWTRSLLGKTGRAKAFALAVLQEDGEKHARVTALAKTIGLPILKSFILSLPSDANQMLHLIAKERQRGWQLSCRVVSDSSGILYYRDLDVDTLAANAVLSHLPPDETLTARISLYRPAVASGTFLVSRGEAFLELVYGPHFWLTKGQPQGVQLLRCCYGDPHGSIRYSTQDVERRGTLFRHVTDLSRLTLGMGLRGVRETEKSVYAEYIWREDFGYRFLDCSYARIWTATV